MTGYEPRIDPPSFPTWRAPWALLPLLAWLAVELPFVAGWVLREKYRSLRAPRGNVAFTLAMAMQQALHIAESDQVPINRRETALVAARNLRSLGEDLGLQDTDMVSRNVDRMEAIEEHGLTMADGGTAAADDTDLHAFCNDCRWHATPEDHDYATVWTAADVHMTFEGHKVTVGLSEETRQEAQARCGGPEASGGAA